MSPTSCASIWIRSAIRTTKLPTGIAGGDRRVERIAFIGVGRMGGPMAARLLAAGHAVTEFDPSATAMATLVARGARAASSAPDAAQGCGIVMASLPSLATVRALAGEVAT